MQTLNYACSNASKRLNNDLRVMGIRRPPQLIPTSTIPYTLNYSRNISAWVERRDVSIRNFLVYLEGLMEGRQGLKG